MHIDSMERARARTALRKVVRDHLFDPNVACVDLGLPEGASAPHPGELRIRVHVHRKLEGARLEQAVDAGETRVLPDAKDGYQIDVLEGSYRPHLFGQRAAVGAWQAVGAHTRRADPMVGGVSISNTRQVAAGTLGGKVVDRSSGAEMLLSNWHVLVGGWAARIGQPICQPGQLDGGTAADTVATLSRDAMAAGLDAAVATSTGSRRLVNDQLDLGPITGLRQAELGMRVAKSGRTSAVTDGRITGVEGIARIRYGYLDRIIREVVTIDPIEGRQVSAPGDSGSIWLDPETMEAVALHFAGSDVPERALGMDIQAVLTALDVQLDTSRPAGVQLARRSPASAWPRPHWWVQP